MAEKKFAAKEVIFKEGDASDVAYVIRTGKVDILKHGDSGEVKLATLKEEDIFGEMGLFDPKSPRSATARTAEDTVLDIITAEELHDMIQQCPKRLMPIINTVFDRLRSSNQRIKSREQATAILDVDVDNITVSPTSEALEGAFEPMVMPVGHLPFRIGGFDADDSRSRSSKNNHLSIASEGPPLTVSSNHCEVIVEDGGLYLRDLGSRFGTTVNGFSIGRGKGVYKASLQKGDNTVILGDKKTSPYTITINCA
ncbi:MAG: cyclic nucleotide-binding domain-containing protein [Rickettsiales bacterium]